MTPFGPSRVGSRDARTANVLDRANSDFPMSFTRLASLRDNPDGPDVTYAMILLRRNSPAGGLRRIDGRSSVLTLTIVSVIPGPAQQEPGILLPSPLDSGFAPNGAPRNDEGYEVSETQH